MPTLHDIVPEFLNCQFYQLLCFCGTIETMWYHTHTQWTRKFRAFKSVSRRLSSLVKIPIFIFCDFASSSSFPSMLLGSPPARRSCWRQFLWLFKTVDKISYDWDWWGVGNGSYFLVGWLWLAKWHLTSTTLAAPVWGIQSSDSQITKIAILGKNQHQRSSFHGKSTTKLSESVTILCFCKRCPSIIRLSFLLQKSQPEKIVIDNTVSKNMTSTWRRK